jgi:hypothetical protein
MGFNLCKRFSVTLEYDRQLLQRAITQWLKTANRDAQKIRIHDMMEFGHLIGHPHNPHSKSQKIIDTDNPEVRRLIDLINGPNGHTIVKMLMARVQDDKN